MDLKDLLQSYRSEFGDSLETPADTIGVVLPSDSPVCKPLSSTSLALFDPLSSSEPRVFNFSNVCSPGQYVDTIKPLVAQSLSIPSSLFFFFGPSLTFLFTEGFLSSLLSLFHGHNFFASLSTLDNTQFYSLDGSLGPSPWQKLEEIEIGPLNDQALERHVLIQLKSYCFEISFVIFCSPESVRHLSTVKSSQLKSWIANDQVDFSRLLTSFITNEWGSTNSFNNHPLFSLLFKSIINSKCVFSFFIPTSGNDFSDSLHLLKLSSMASRLRTIVMETESDEGKEKTFSEIHRLDQSDCSSVSVSCSEGSCRISLGSPEKSSTADPDIQATSVSSQQLEKSSTADPDIQATSVSSQQLEKSSTADPDIQATIVSSQQLEKSSTADPDIQVASVSSLADVPISEFATPAPENVLLERLSIAQQLILSQESTIGQLQITNEETFLTLSTALEDSKRIILDLEERIRLVAAKNEVDDVIDYYENVIEGLNSRLEQLMVLNNADEGKSTSQKYNNQALIIQDLKKEREVLLLELKKLREESAKNQSYLLRNQLKDCRKSLSSEKQSHLKTKQQLESLKKEIVELRQITSEKSREEVRKATTNTSALKTLAEKLVESESESKEIEFATQIASLVSKTKPQRSKSRPPSRPRYSEVLDRSFVKAKLSNRKDPVESFLEHVKELSVSESRKVLAKIQDFIMDNMSEFF
ncbi:hypothetical protein P9112_004617 [Eukaryota sp. TZLM1-RC]